MFYKSANNIDDLMRAVFERLLRRRGNHRAISRKGVSTEVFGALLELTNPRARLSRSSARSRVFSALGELTWYLAASNSLDHIRHYIPSYGSFSADGTTLYGAYGPRVFSPERRTGVPAASEQWGRVMELLGRRGGSRNGVIQVLSNQDIHDANLDIPCTCTLQFVVRNRFVNLHVHMRSNDAFLGLPHDIFSFTMLQEIAARELGLDVGRYTHSVASLHLYDDDEDGKIRSRTHAQAFVEEGLFDVKPMPAMPKGDPWPSIRGLLAAEEAIRLGGPHLGDTTPLDPYWTDLVLLLRAHAIGGTNGGNPDDLQEILARLSSDTYALYVLDRLARKRKRDTDTLDIFEGTRQ